MLKSTLRENGYSEEEKVPKQFIITILWVILTLLVIAVTVYNKSYVKINKKKKSELIKQ